MAVKAMQGLHVNYICEGSGPPVIFIHNVGGSLRHWDFLFPEVVAHKYEAYALDLLGHGESAKPSYDQKGYHIDAIYAHMANWISRLDLHTSPILVGHGVGSYLILTYALRNPGKIRGMILTSPYFSPDQLTFPLRFPIRQPKLSTKILTIAPKWAISSAFFLTKRGGDQFSKSIRKRFVEDVKRSDPAVITFASTTRDLTPHLSRIKTRAFVVWGEKDPLFDIKLYPKIVEAVPNAVPCPIPGSHNLHLTNYRYYNNHVLRFLEQLSGSTSLEKDTLKPKAEYAS